MDRFGLAHRISRKQDRLLDRLHDRRADAAAGLPGTADSFAGLIGEEYALLVTFKRSGEPVPTPVWFGLHAVTSMSRASRMPARSSDWHMIATSGSPRAPFAANRTARSPTASVESSRPLKSRTPSQRSIGTTVCAGAYERPALRGKRASRRRSLSSSGPCPTGRVLWRRSARAGRCGARDRVRHLSLARSSPRDAAAAGRRDAERPAAA